MQLAQRPLCDIPRDYRQCLRIDPSARMILSDKCCGSMAEPVAERPERLCVYAGNCIQIPGPCSTFLAGGLTDMMVKKLSY